MDKNEKIITEDIGKEMSASYLDYSMSVITSRALPDIRDGLKPVHRRILYAMYKMGLAPGAKTRKSAAITGEVLGKYHPHGNVAVYDAMAKLAQDFKTRYPLVIGQGNFGSIDGDMPAAERYTEAKLSKLSETMLLDIEKDTVNFLPNYENTLKEPQVLPALAPNLFLNGSFGIAVGMMTRIPPHNLSELCQAIKSYIENKNISINELMTIVKGPDFPTGAVVYDVKAIKEAYKTGMGVALTRGEVDVIEDNKKFSLAITSIPYGINKSDLIMKIGDLIQAKIIEGVKDLRDESTKDIRIVIDLKNTANPEKIKNLLYKKTELETKFHYNMVCLVNGAPQTINLIDYLENYVEYRRLVVKKRLQFDLEKARATLHVLEGLEKAINNIDAIIKLIKKSKSPGDARKNLMTGFQFTEIQANAILDMKLQKLSSLEVEKIVKEVKNLKVLIKQITEILKSKTKIDREVLTELDKFIKDFSDVRRTKVVKNKPGDITDEDLIEAKDVLITLSRHGYIKVSAFTEYRSQKRGGTGSKGSETKDEDYVNLSLNVSTHDKIFFLTNKGKIYQQSVHQFPEGKRTAKGRALINYISIDTKEYATSMLRIRKDTNTNAKALLFITKKGLVKKTLLNQFQNIRKSGIVAITLDKEDELIASSLVNDGDTVFIATQNGKCIRFKESGIRASGRSSKGIKGINLSGGDIVISGFVIQKETKDDLRIMTISESSYGKATVLSETNFKIQNRGGSGVKIAEINDKTGRLVSSHLLKPEKREIIVISKSNIIKMEVGSIPNRNRDTQGVKLMKLRSGDKISSTVYI